MKQRSRTGPGNQPLLVSTGAGSLRTCDSKTNERDPTSAGVTSSEFEGSLVGGAGAGDGIEGSLGRRRLGRRREGLSWKICGGGGGGGFGGGPAKVEEEEEVRREDKEEALILQLLLRRGL